MVAVWKDQLQRSCSIQPSVGAMVAMRKHLRRVNGQNENSSEGVVETEFNTKTQRPEVAKENSFALRVSAPLRLCVKNLCRWAE